MAKLLNQQLQAQRAQLEESIKDLHELTIRIGHEELSATLSELRNRLHEPFMFVIVGEVKAGKSSFINALLATGEEITKVAPQPMTDTIQQILYGEERAEVQVNEYLKKIILPVDILRDIAIVDTPGTNTIVEHHQEITERFVPASDLIVFVFEAKNPYRQSAWSFFDFIQGEWRKKVIFVLQQKDLMPAEDLAINIQGVRDFALKKGMTEPHIFAVSAKQEQEGLVADSGFLPLRNYITDNITGGQAPALKLFNSVQTAQNINARITEGLVLRRQQFHADEAFRDQIDETLNEQERKSYKQVELLSDALLGAYDRITTKKYLELEAGLSLFGLLKRSVSSIFTKTPGAQEWLTQLAKELEDELNTALQKRLNEGMIDLAGSIQQMAKMIDLQIRSSKTILSNDHEIFSDIAERRENVLRDLQDQFSRFISRTENFTDESLFPERTNLSPNLAAGSGIAAIGVILMTVSQIGMLDVTGGILTAIGILFAGFSTRSKRRKVTEGFQLEIDRGRERLLGEVTDTLKTYIQHLKQRIAANFLRFDEHLAKEGKHLVDLESQHREINTRLNQLEADLQK
ncbi:MAG: GTP-binding protein [Bacteroidetes bacterium]|nr:MAG: GTP-binding protein [Bacteroidota bacterium]